MLRESDRKKKQAEKWKKDIFHQRQGADDGYILTCSTENCPSADPRCSIAERHPARLKQQEA